MSNIRRYWWTVWIKVAVLAVAMLIAYRYASDKIEEMFSPYVIEETQETGETVDSEDTENLLTKLLGKVEDAFDVKLDYENMIFDYANDYTKTIKDESKAEREGITEKLS